MITLTFNLLDLIIIFNNQPEIRIYADWCQFKTDIIFSKCNSYKAEFRLFIVWFIINHLDI